jgi:four helix bundle protein
MFLRKNKVEKELLIQLLKSGTSVGANVEEAEGAQSNADFIHKMDIAYKEAREAHYWLRILRDSSLMEERA